MIIVEIPNGGKDIGLFLLPPLGEGGDGAGPLMAKSSLWIRL
jgi:hypothetical protein